MSSFALAAAGTVGPYNISYSGRMIYPSGQPRSGSVDLIIGFYADASTTTLKVTPFPFDSVPLTDGIFQITIPISSSDAPIIFDGATDTWIQVTDVTHGVTYPRQSFTYLPYALRVPVDDSTIGFNTSGQLALKNTEAAGSQILSVLNSGLGTISSSVLPTLAGDVTGSATVNQVTKIQNVPVASPSSGNDSGKYLQYNGSSFVLSPISGSGGGTVTSVAVTSPLVATGNTGIAPTISMPTASAVADGYLSSSDWNAFNNTNSGLPPATSSSNGYLASADWIVFNSNAMSLGFTPVNKAGDTMSGPLVLGSQNDLRFGPASGANYVSLKAPATVSNIVTWTLPAADGTSGQILSTNGSGLLSWMNQAAAPVSSVAGRTGAITLTTSDVAEGTPLYYTDARSRAALSAISPLSYSNSTGSFSIPMAASNAHGYLSSGDWTTFNGKQFSMASAASASSGWLTSSDWIAFNSKEPAVSNPADSTKYYSGDKTWQTLNTNAVAEGSNLFYSDARARSAISTSAPLVYSSASGIVSLPNATSSADGYLSSGDWSTFNTGSTQWSASNGNIYRSSGNIGIGTTSPTGSLDVSGQMRSVTFVTPSNSNVFDMNHGNNQISQQTGTGNGPITITLNNVLDGGTYTIAMKDSQGGTYSFTASGVSTWKYLPTNSATDAGKDALFMIKILGDTGYVSWMSGF